MVADFDLIIRNGRVIDGTGNPWFRADIGVSEGRVKRLSRVPLEGAEKVIDARGLVVCPGFVNLHSHSDATILSHNNAENCLAMGLVTELVGSCGSSSAPLTEEYREKLRERGVEGWGLLEEEIDWLSLADWRNKLEEREIGVNIAPLVGQGTVRGMVMGAEGEGGERIVPSEEEMAAMKGLVGSAMEDGAFGLSTGLTYAPGRNALTAELIELVSVVARYGGLYSSHMRCEGDRLLEATREFIEICERAGVRGTISHHKAMGRGNYGKVNETLRMVTRARERGVDIIVDQYPWRHGGVTKSLGARFKSKDPEGPVIQTREELVDNLRDPEKWRRVKAAALERQNRELENYRKREEMMREEGGWTSAPFFTSTSGVILHSRSHPEFEGRTFQEVAESLGETDFIEGIRRLLLDDEGYTVSGNYPYSEDDIVTIMRYPWTTVSTDQYAFDASKIGLQGMADALAMQHPRGWGTYPKILGRYVREEKALTLEEAVRKMTSLPATFLGLQDRGIVREGFWADLVVFDNEEVGNQATYGNPIKRPSGIPYVLVNGELAVDDEELTGALAGKVLKHST